MPTRTAPGAARRTVFCCTPGVRRTPLARRVARVLACALAAVPLLFAQPAAHAQAPAAWVLDSFEVVYRDNDRELRRETLPAGATRDFTWGGTKHYDNYPFGDLRAEGQLHITLPDQFVPGQPFTIGGRATGKIETPGRQGRTAATMGISNECYVVAACQGAAKSEYKDEIQGKTVEYALELAPVTVTVPADPTSWPASTTLFFRGGIGTTTAGDPYWRIVVYAYYRRPAETPPGYSLDLEAETTRLPPSGPTASETTITATVRDGAGQPVAGELVSFRLEPPDMGSMPPTAVTNANGEAVGRYRAPLVGVLAGRDSVTIVASNQRRGLERGLALRIERYRLALTVEPTDIPVEPVWRAVRVAVEVRDFDGRPVPGEVIQLRVHPPDMGEFIGEAISGNRGVTGSDGRLAGFYEPPPPERLKGRDTATLYATNLTHGGDAGVAVRFLGLKLARTWPEPDARDVDLAPGDTIDFEFDRPVDPQTVNARTVTLASLWHGDLGAQVETFGRTVRIRLTQDPLPDVGLRLLARVAGGPDGLRGRDGSLLLGPAELRFRTLPRLAPRVILSQVVDEPRDLLLGNLAVAPKPFVVRVEAGLSADSELDDEVVDVQLTGPNAGDTATVTQRFYPGRWPPLVPLPALRQGNSAVFVLREPPAPGNSYTFGASLRPAAAPADKAVQADPVTVYIRRWQSPQAATSIGIFGVPLVNDAIPAYGWRVSRGQMQRWWTGMAEPASALLPVNRLSTRLGYFADTTCADAEKCPPGSPWARFAYWARHVGRAGVLTSLFGPRFEYVVALVPPGFFDTLADDPDVAAHPDRYHGAALSGIWSERTSAPGQPASSAWPVPVMEVDSPPEVLAHALGDALNLAHSNGRWDPLAGYNLATDTVIRSEENDWTGAFKAVMNETVGSAPSWPAIADYNAFLDHFTDRRGFQPRAAGQPGASTGRSAGPVQMPGAAAVPALLVSGTLRRGGGGAVSASLDPLVAGALVPSLPGPGAGDFAVVLRAADGAILARHAFAPVFGPVSGGELATFLLTVPADPPPAALAIEHAGRAVVERARSGHSPDVRFLQPRSGGSYRGAVTVTWMGDDVDGDAPTFSLLFSGDGGKSWAPLVADTSATSYTLASEEVPNGPAARLRLLASDGFNVADAQLDFALVNPQQVLAEHPADGALGVPLNTRVLAQLRDPLDPAAIGDGDLALFDASGRAVPGRLTYSPVDSTFVFTPTLPLRQAMRYEARLTGGLRTPDGRGLGADHVWFFTTRGQAIWLPSLAQRLSGAPATATPGRSPSAVPTRTAGPSRTPTRMASPTWTPDAVATRVAATLTALVPPPSATPDVVGTAVAATRTALAPSPTAATPTPTPASPTPPARVTVDGATITGADPARPRMAFGPGESITLWLHVVNAGGAPVPVEFDLEVAGDGGLAVPELGWRGTVDVAPGPGWYQLARTVPASAAPGPYTFNGRVTFGGVTTAATSDLYLAGTLLLADDFGDPGSGWATSEDASGRHGYLGGEYQVRVDRAGYARWASPIDSPTATSLALEADVRMPGPQAGVAALVFGLNRDGSDYHIWEITGDGRHALFRWSGGAWQTLVPFAASPALYAGSAVNHLLLVRDSGLTRLYANGQAITTITDIAVPAGRAGVYASAQDAGFEARFDNYRLYGLP